MIGEVICNGKKRVFNQATIIFTLSTLVCIGYIHQSPQKLTSRFSRFVKCVQFLTAEERKELVAQAKAEKEQKAMESALRKKELQDCKFIEYGAKLTEVM